VVSGVVIHGKQTKIPELNGDLWENHQTRWLIFQPAPRLMITGGFFFYQTFTSTTRIQQRNIWLVVLTCFYHLEKMSSSMGRMTSHTWNGK